MVRVLAVVSDYLLLLATVVLAVLAAVLVVTACWGLGQALLTGESPRQQVVDSISLLVIAVAVMALSKYIVEEEVDRRRELRSPAEARRSLTKFITIIIVAFSLEALVMVFEAQHENAHEALYATALFAVVVLALVGLGVFQWLSNQVEQAAGAVDRAADDEDDDRRSRGGSHRAISARNKTAGGDDDDSRDRPGHRNHRA